MIFTTAKFCSINNVSFPCSISVGTPPVVIVTTATKPFTVIKDSNKIHLQEYTSTFITAHMFGAAGSKDTCGKLKCEFFLLPGST